ncbi:MAG: hypothetical protein ACSHX6_08325 [Akkermansiaceae bacterium]
MDNEMRRLCAWFETKLEQKFEIYDQEGNQLGEWMLEEVERLPSFKTSEGEELDCYWLKFDSKTQWYDGQYHLKAEDGERVVLFANALSATQMQSSVN